MTFDSSKLGKIVRERRESLGLSQEALAELSDLNRNYIGEIERGEVNVSISILAKLADGLAITMSELFQFYEQECSE